MKISFIFFIFSSLFLVPSVFAHCPLCTAATGAAVAVTRWYGLDDSIVGVFIGGMIVATELWINNLLKKLNRGKEYLKYQAFIIMLVSFVATLLPFYFTDLIGPNNPFKIFGIDKILFGTFIGIAVSFLSFGIHDILRTMNRNRNYLPYQSIMILILALATCSTILFLVM